MIRKIIQNMYLYFNNIVFQQSCSHMSMGDIMNISAFLGPVFLHGVRADCCLIPELLLPAQGEVIHISMAAFVF